jgi:hypothetical protein
MILFYLMGRGVFLKRRSMDNLFLNRMITPVEDAADDEADKTRDKDPPQVRLNFF